jgi:receptor protein-tyrosine kinase
MEGHQPDRETRVEAALLETTADEILPPETPADALLAGVKMAPLRIEPSSPVMPFDGTHWRAGEQYRSLRTRIVQHPKRPQVVLVTSAGPNDGKTVTAINIAGAMALKDNARVLLIDGDFRRSTAALKLGMPDSAGLASILTGQCSFTEALFCAEQIPNLFFLPAGETEVNPAELLDSLRWHAACTTARGLFDYIIIDSTPLGAVADYDLIQAVCDGVIIVIRPDQTNRQRCLTAIKTAPKEKLLGVIVNCVEGRLLDKERQYGDYYYRGPEFGKR